LICDEEPAGRAFSGVLLRTRDIEEAFMNKVNVYRFWVSDTDKTRSILAPRAATAEAIAKIERARPINATAEEVEEFRLDGDGFLNV
jgi:hypothetical protein